ncbi:MAG: hypothetical protein NVS2B11_00830 [Acetobacteraceae bacterium]
MIVPDGGAGAEVGAAEVDRHHLVPKRRLGVEQRLAGAHDGVVDQDVDPAIRGHHLPEQPLHRSRVGDVAGEEAGPASLGGDHGADRLAALDHRLGHVGDDHLRALCGEQARNGAADTGRTAGHDRDLAVEPGHAGGPGHGPISAWPSGPRRQAM